MANELRPPQAPPTCFLNLDGVVHPPETSYIWNEKLPDEPRPFVWAESLRPVVERWNLDIVLRSSATTFVREDILLSSMPLWLRGRLIGKTQPTHIHITLDWIRKSNTSLGVIRNYVKQHDLKHWVVLADDDDGWPEDPDIRRHLVLCDPLEGVTNPATMARLEEALAVCKQ